MEIAVPPASDYYSFLEDPHTIARWDDEKGEFVDLGGACPTKWHAERLIAQHARWDNGVKMAKALIDVNRAIRKLERAYAGEGALDHIYKKLVSTYDNRAHAGA